MTEAQIHIDGLYTDKALAIGELRPGPALIDKLTGKLVIKNYPNITGINLNDQELTELEIINCPKLTNISVLGGNIPHLKILNFDKIKTHDNTENGNVVNNGLTHLNCSSNDIEKLSFRYCPELKVLLCQDNPLKILKSLEHLKALTNINTGDGKLGVMGAVKLEFYQDLLGAVKDLLKIVDPNDSLPKDPGTKKLIVDTLKTKIENAIVVKIEKEGGGFKVERDQLNKQLSSIVTKLGLAENSTEQQILDKIGELINRPSSAVVDQKNSEIAQKDSKISELEQQLAAEKQKNAELQNQIDDSVTRADVIQKIENNLVSLGISSAARTTMINDTSSAEAAMDAGNKLFEEEWKKERDAKKQSFYLNIALIGLLSLALVALTWLIMKESKLSIKEEDKKRIKK